MSKLDQLVKGAAPPGTSVPSVASNLPHTAETDTLDVSAKQIPDPLANLPSSPPQIYLNLLILEASLRSQYLTLRARRRQNTLFLFLLSVWNAFFFYALFLQPREDGSGIGGSVYWVVETTEKVALMGGVVTGILVWGTGQWERGIRWPRRFVGVTNRGLRTVNCKIIVMKGRWWQEILEMMSFLLPWSSYYVSHGSSYHYVKVPSDRRHLHNSKHGRFGEPDSAREEDLAPGGDCIKLLLLPKPFSPDFRENWELYRTEYWERENERRGALLRELRLQKRLQAKEDGGWFWWLGWGGRSRRPSTAKEGDVEKSYARHLLEKDLKRISGKRGESHSRNTSRSSTPSTVDADERPPSRGSRRSSGTFTDGRKRSKAGSHMGTQPLTRLTPYNQPTRNSMSGSASAGHSPLVRGSGSFGTSSGNESDTLDGFAKYDVGTT